MYAMTPYVDVPGDNAEAQPLPGGGWLRPRIMGRSGTLMGLTPTRAVWRFGFTTDSESACAFGVTMPGDGEGFLWVLATRKTGKVLETYRGFALDMPHDFRKVIANG